MYSYQIVVPIYRFPLKEFESLVLSRLRALYNKDLVSLVYPSHIEKEIHNELGDANFRLRSFDSEYFQNISSYNRLCLSIDFYKAFESYNYILIHQLDAFILNDDLNKWLDCGYDYVAPPWVGIDTFKFIKGTYEGSVPPLLKAKLLPWHKLLFRHDFQVGNGGLSLRKVSTFKKLLRLFAKQASSWSYNEDLFFSLWVPAHYPLFKVPTMEQALSFGFDLNPLKAFELNNRQLPMAVHGFDKADYFNEWKEILKISRHDEFQKTLDSIKGG